MSRKFVVLSAALLLCLMPFASRAETDHSDLETALVVQSWCKAIVSAKFGADRRVFFTQNQDTGFCWGAFATIQELSKYASSENARMLGICTPSTSTRIQLIKIFSKYVDDHPEAANQSFSDVALLSLTQAFPCTGAGPQR
jgi:hypothetical protein